MMDYFIGDFYVGCVKKIGAVYRLFGHPNGLTGRQTRGWTALFSKGLWIGLALCGGASPSAWALVVGNVSLSQNLVHTDNLYNTPQDQALSDWSTSTGLGGRVVVPWGRQVWNNNFSVKTLRYQNQTHNNTVNYSGSSAWNWQTAGNLSGSLAVTGAKNKYVSGLDDVENTTELNLTTTRGVSANIELGAGQVLSFSGGVSQKSLSYSQASFQKNNLEQMDFSLGGQWLPHPDTKFILNVGQGAGDFPRAVSGTSSGFESQSINLTSHINLLEVHKVIASLGYYQQSYQGAQNHTHGWNGDLNWRTKLSSRVNATASFQHGRRRSVNTWEIAANPNKPDDPVLALDFIGSTINTTIGANLTWSVSSKIQLFVNATQTQRKTANDSPLVGNDGVPYKDESLNLNFGLTYKILRSTSFSCRVNSQRHQVISAAAGVLANDFRTFSSDCGVTVGFP